MTHADDPVELTIIQAMRPRTLSKRIEQGPNGSLRKTGGGVLVEGSAKTCTVSSLDEFAKILLALEPNQALAYGLPARSSCTLMSRRLHAARGASETVLTRTRDRFAWPRGAGVMMLDHDPVGDERISREDLVAIIRRAAAGIANVAMLWWPSASSHIHETTTGVDLSGLRGQRLYMVVADARDIPRAGAALVDRLWATGNGAIRVSEAGTALERCPIDAFVWQPERLDFAAGAVCGPGLEQRRGDPVLIPGLPVVDTRAALPDDASIRMAADAARSQARVVAAPELAAARESCCRRRAEKMLSQEERRDPDRLDAAMVVARRAVEHRVLGGDWPIDVVSDDGDVVATTVRTILSDPAKYNGILCRDPIEPDYDDGRIVGKLFIGDACPRLHSFARGGRTFRLIRAPHRIELVKGRTVDATDETADLLARDPGVFDLGGQVVVVEAGQPFPFDEHSLAHHIGGLVQFWRMRQTAGANDPVDHVDPPQRLVRQVASLAVRRGLTPLDAVISAPILRRDASVLDRPGYDEKTRLFYDPGGVEPPVVPEAPSIEQCRTALEALFEPFAGCPFVDHLARGACLAGLLTASLRPTLATAPGFAVDAPVQGSGKTLLASCLAALATGRMPDIWPHTAGRDDEEVRKRLFAALQGGAGAIVWDNVVGIMNSAALAAALTAPIYSDRVLGKSKSAHVPNRAMLLVTGNNLCLAGDLPRRVLVCRIDPETSTPFARRFDIDPLEVVLGDRLELVTAALTLVRGAQVHSRGPRAAWRASRSGTISSDRRFAGSTEISRRDSSATRWTLCGTPRPMTRNRRCLALS